jgi:nucleoside-diphosphate-sugar epimerase
VTRGIGPVIVAGGTGFLGSHLVERLAGQGRGVRILSRGGRWPWGAPPPGLEIARVDLGDPRSAAALPELIQGASAVVNLAGVLWRPGMSARVYPRLHVDGTDRLLAATRVAARRQAPLRVVHVSTTGVLGPTGPAPLDEDARPRPSTVYERTKLEGERRALAASGEGVEVAVIRPGLVYGERDLHLLGLWRAIAAGTFRRIEGGRARWQPIHVADAVRAIALAVDHPSAAGGVFHVAGRDAVTVSDLAHRIAALLGRGIAGPDLPRGMAWVSGALLEVLFSPFGIDPPLSRGRVRTLTEDRLYGIERARATLGFEPAIGLDEGLSRTAAWYREHGHL